MHASPWNAGSICTLHWQCTWWTQMKQYNGEQLQGRQQSYNQQVWLWCDQTRQEGVLEQAGEDSPAIQEPFLRPLSRLSCLLRRGDKVEKGLHQGRHSGGILWVSSTRFHGFIKKNYVLQWDFEWSQKDANLCQHVCYCSQCSAKAFTWSAALFCPQSRLGAIKLKGGRCSIPQPHGVSKECKFPFVLHAPDPINKREWVGN